MTIHTVITTQFCVKLECTRAIDPRKFWAILVYASTDTQIKQQQWEYLMLERSTWGEDWFFGGFGGGGRGAT